MREFDNLSEKLYGDFVDDFNDYAESEILIILTSTVLREEVGFVIVYALL